MRRKHTKKKKENKVLWQGSNYFLQKTKKTYLMYVKKQKKMKLKKQKT